MKYENWSIPIKASWQRGTELEELVSKNGKLLLRLVEEETECVWELTFMQVQAFKKTTQECIRFVLRDETATEAFMKVLDSTWIDELGKGKLSFLNNAVHYLIFTYEELIEVVAADFKIEKL